MASLLKRLWSPKKMDILLDKSKTDLDDMAFLELTSKAKDKCGVKGLTFEYAAPCFDFLTFQHSSWIS